MGEAIISTPISRLLPVELTNCTQILIKDISKKDISDKIQMILSNNKLKNHLEFNAKKY